MNRGDQPAVARPPQPTPTAVVSTPAMPPAEAVSDPPTPAIGGADHSAGMLAAAAAQAPAAAPTAASATPPPSPPPASGTRPPTPPETGAPPKWRARRHRSLPRLRLGQHGVPIDKLDQLPIRRGSFGLRLGVSRNGEPVALRLFRPQPTRVLLVAGAWAAELLSFRALRSGARAVVFSELAAGWIELGRRATGRTDRVAVRVPGDEVVTVASADVPVLRLDSIGQASEADLPGWTTRLSVLPPGAVGQHAAVPTRAAQMAGCDLMLTQRLPPHEIAVLASLWGLTPQTQQALSVLPDAVLAVLTKSSVEYAWVDLTDAEREVLSVLPRR